MEHYQQLIKTVSFQEYIDSEKVDILLKFTKDEDTGERNIEIIENPNFSYYVTKDDKWLDLPVAYISKDDVREVITPSYNVVKSVAYETGQEDFFWNCIRQKKFRMSKAVFLNPNVHGSDINLEDYYIGKHFDQYPLNQSKNKFNKAFFDIEVDSMNIIGFPNPEDAECPINAVSFYNEENNTLYGLFLRNEKNPLIEDFEENKLSSFKKRIKKKYDEKGIKNLKIKLVWYDDEINLISDFFYLINKLKPDFAGAWNLTGFDIAYFINRIAVLGYSPQDVICTDETDYAYLNLYIDSKNQDPEDNGSYFKCSAYTNYLDMMILYAALRKASGKKESYSLDAISYDELGENKLEFKNPNTTTKNSAYIDYEEFIEYNIHDTMLLYMLEKKNNDFNMIYMLGGITETRIEKALKKTTCLKNLARRFYYNKGYIMSNNHNTNYGGINEVKKEEFRGAFVADPLLNNPNGVDIIGNGSLSKFIFENVIDFDLESLYPSIILAFNIDETTQIGEIIFNNDNDEEFNGPEFADDLVSKDYINLGHKYFKLPNIENMIPILDKIENS